MRRTMVGVAPAANAPVAASFEGRDAFGGNEGADTAVAIPPDMAKALAEMTMQSNGAASNGAGAPSSGPQSAPMTRRMSEAPLKAASIAPSPPRSAPSVAPPRSAPSVTPPRSSPSTDPMAPPLDRKPLVTTSALAPPINVVGGASNRASMSPSPPAYRSAPPAPSTMLGMPSAIGEATLASSPVDFDKTRVEPRQAPRKDETMVLAPHTSPAPVPATVSMAPPMPRTVSGSMPQASMAPAMQQPSMAPPVPRTVVSGPMPQASMAPQMQPSMAPVPVRSLPPPYASPAPFAAAQQAPAHQSWSSAHAIRTSTTQDPPSGSPLTYQVFDPAAAPAARPSMMSRASFPEERSSPKASLGLRVCLVLLGVCVVLGTAGAIIIGASEDPPHTAKPSPSASAVALATAEAPVPPALPIAPVPVVLPDPPPVATTAPTTTATTKPAASAKTKPAGSAPPALKGAKVPPNPFGGGPLPVKRK